MKRVRLVVPVTYHPDAGGTRRQGEVFDLSDELGAHWIKNAVAEDATDAELTEALVPIEPIGPGLWPDGSEQADLGDATADGAVLNTTGDGPRPAGTPYPATVGPTRQRRAR